MGTVFSTTALVLWFGFGEHTATWAVLGLVVVAAALESLAVFGLLMKAGVIPERVCLECADLSLRHPKLVADGRATS
jgi:hypothetical protein